MTRVAVIGGGVSGRLLALNLLRQGSGELELRLFEKRGPDDVGPAYSDPSEALLLNVPAGIMGAFSGDREHFLRWAQARGVPAEWGSYLPRRLYRQYVLELLAGEIETRARLPGIGAGGATEGKAASFEQIQGEVSDLEVPTDGGPITLHVPDHGSYEADQVVLALGNFPPRNVVSPPEGPAAGRYVPDPWDTRVLDALSADDTVVLIGTGQTTVDLLLALHERRHRGRMVAISRRGVFPLVHRGFDSYPSFVDEIEPSDGIRALLRTVRRHLAGAAARGIDARAVIDSLRPDTQAIWTRLLEVEKRRFLRHLVRHWEVIRSRIPPESAAVVEGLRASGQLHVVSGRVRGMVGGEAGIEVRFLRRGGAGEEVEQAGLVLNCVGPECDYRRIDHPLVVNLLRRGLIRPGPAGQGIDALPDGTVLGTGARASPGLSTLGPTLRGVLWETIAVSEIRLQAERLASRLLRSAGAEDDPPRAGAG